MYVGQTGDLRARLASHNRDRDFWERALVVISRTNSLTQTHALFLEWHCIQADGQLLRFTRDHLFRTRSGAASVLPVCCSGGVRMAGSSG